MSGTSRYGMATNCRGFCAKAHKVLLEGRDVLHGGGVQGGVFFVFSIRRIFNLQGHLNVVTKVRLSSDSFETLFGHTVNIAMLTLNLSNWAKSVSSGRGPRDLLGPPVIPPSPSVRPSVGRCHCSYVRPPTSTPNTPRVFPVIESLYFILMFMHKKLGYWRRRPREVRLHVCMCTFT